jgi:hypothetical protein
MAGCCWRIRRDIARITARRWRSFFRDQGRDAWSESQAWGVAKLWLRTVPDLVNTSISERLAAFNPRKSMSDKMTALFRPLTSPLTGMADDN